MKTRLSVNVNKIATLRNARGGNIPNLYQFVKDIQKFGIHGVTVHPRPDERHVTLKDTYEISKILKQTIISKGILLKDLFKSYLKLNLSKQLLFLMLMMLLHQIRDGIQLKTNHY